MNTSLILHHDVDVRTIFNNLYFLICKVNPEIKKSYYQLNLSQNHDHYANGAKLNEDRFVQFYDTFNKILLSESNEDELNIYQQVSMAIQKSFTSYAQISQHS